GTHVYFQKPGNRVYLQLDGLPASGGWSCGNPGAMDNPRDSCPYNPMSVQFSAVAAAIPTELRCSQATIRIAAGKTAKNHLHNIRNRPNCGRPFASSSSAIAANPIHS